MEGYERSKHQAAGHDGCMTSERQGGIFIKKTVAQEVEFYQQTATKTYDENRLEGSQLVDWMPVFMGTLQEGRALSAGTAKETGVFVMGDDEQGAHLDGTKNDQQSAPKSGEGDEQYIVLENLYRGYKFPSIMDIKLGAQLTDDTVTAEKAARLKKVSENTTSGSLGFRICGMKTYCGREAKAPTNVYADMYKHYSIEESNDGSRYLVFSKFFGRTLNKQTIEEGILRYFDCYHKNKFILKNLVNTFKNRLSLLYNCLLDEEVRIFSGSLLFIYENDDDRWAEVLDNEEGYMNNDPLVREPNLEDSDSCDEDSDSEDKTSRKEEQKAPLSSLNMIDFAHASYTKSRGYDENVVAGIENLITIFESIYNNLDSDD